MQRLGQSKMDAVRREEKTQEPAQHSTAQHSTAQHSTAQHNLTLSPTALNTYGPLQLFDTWRTLSNHRPTSSTTIV